MLTRSGLMYNSHAQSHLREYSSKTQGYQYFCYKWTVTEDSNRQWSIIYVLTAQHIKPTWIKWYIRHIYIAPQHPSSNGLAERAVQAFQQTICQIPGSSARQ